MWVYKFKIMKKILFLLLISFTLMEVGCKKFLEVQPQFKFNEDLATNTLDGFDKAMTGAFNQLQSSNLYGGGIIANSELLADFVNTDPIGDFSLNQFRTRSLNPFNSESSGMWNDAYRAIHICNLLLQKLPQYESQNAPLVHKLQGECYFIRAVMHYELVRMFAQPSGFSNGDSHLGVPIRLTPGSTTEGQNSSRATVSEVYAQVTGDLKAAKDLLPTDNTTRASKWAAEAFLAKVYFSQNKWSDAKLWADDIITNGGFVLNDSVQTAYNATGFTFSNEIIFQLINITSDKENGKLTGRFRANVFPAVYRASDALKPYLSSDSAQGSKRYALWKKIGPKYYTIKYDNLDMNVPLVRLVEIYLLRAECRVQLNEPNGDVRADYNVTRQRAGLPADNNTFGLQNLLTAIWNERDMELAYEGDRFFEVKRRKGTFHTPIGDFQWSDPKLVYPVPQQEVDQNPNVVQNEGY